MTWAGHLPWITLLDLILVFWEMDQLSSNQRPSMNLHSQLRDQFVRDSAREPREILSILSWHDG